MTDTLNPGKPPKQPQVSVRLHSAQRSALRILAERYHVTEAAILRDLFVQVASELLRDELDPDAVSANVQKGSIELLREYNMNYNLRPERLPPPSITGRRQSSERGIDVDASKENPKKASGT